MNNQKVLATFLVAVLAASAFSVVGLSAAPLQRASAQTVTIETSADALGGQFFGGMLQVIIEDTSADDETEDDIQVTVDLSSSDGDTSQTITVSDTSDGSQRFEFFIVHVDALDQLPDDPEGDDIAADDHILLFGPGAGADELEVAGLDLYDDASFDIRRSNEEVTIDYEESSAVLELDRSTYGSDSIVYMTIVDQDGNLDPTASGLFDVDNADLTGLFDMTGANFGTGNITLDETGDNTARFEITLQLTNETSGAENELVFTSDAVQVTLNDMANYQDASGNFTGAENDSTDTSSRSFDVEDDDGELSEVTSLTFSSELKINLDDNDRNRDSDDDETLDEVVIVRIEEGDVNGDGILDAGDADQEVLDMEETDDNTGIFVIDLSNNELPVTFLADGEDPVIGNSILEFRGDEITDDVVIEYNDTRDSDSLISITSSQTIEMSLATGSIDVPDAVGINDDFIVTLTDGDLNNNPRTRDSYTFSLDGTGEYSLARGGDSLGDLATLEVEIEGDPVDFADAIDDTLVETDINSGVFTVELDMQDILDSTGVDVDDGDTLEITYNDRMDDTSRESSDELSIGEATAGLDFSRTALPIPPDPDSAVADEDIGIGEEVFVTIMVTDPNANVESNAEDEIPFTIGTGEQEFIIEIEGDGFDATIDAPGEEDTEDFDGAVLSDILPDIDTLELTETGPATGVFDEELVFVRGGLDSDSFHDLEITITYIDTDGDEESGGITFRGNDGAVTVDQASAKSGTVLNIVVEDQDLNLDDDTTEEFEGTVEATGVFIVSVETEDEELPGETTETFRETGADTGIFTASYTVGTDIPITDLADDDDEVEQATNILITYNDEVDGTGGGGDEIEVNVPVVSSTGAITVTPELVGPGTEVTVIITDSDLDEDSRSTDNYDTPDPDEDDFFVSFRSDRTEVGRASPDIEETGPNTGVFTFTIELITDESACEDDDLGEAKFEAQGGSEPEMGACPGDLISVRYEDEQDGSGRSAAVSAIIEVKSWDPEFTSDKASYSPGERVTVTISDPDANRKPDVADSLTDIRVFSDSDRVGEELSALETGRDTGVFRLSFGTSTGTTGGAITVRSGDTVSVEYTDEFPADFEEEEDDKDFTFNVPFGAPGANDRATSPSEPVVKDVSGGSVDDIVPGQQVVLSTTVQNNLDEDLPFVALIEVRDSSGITVFLAWQTGTLNADGRAEVGLSWTPDRSGDYQVRTFVVSNLSNPQVLSPVMTSNITVS